jgi:hypothetical protein
MISRDNASEAAERLTLGHAIKRRTAERASRLTCDSAGPGKVQSSTTREVAR